MSESRRVCVVGSGWRFTSGISYYTCRLSNAMAERHDVSVILMRRLIPALLYPGRRRVGRPVNAIDYGHGVSVFDGVDWFWGLTLVRALRFLRRERPEVVALQWWTGAVLHTYVLIAFFASRLGAQVVVEFHETQDSGESRLPLVRRYAGAMARVLLRRSSGVIVHSEFDRQQVHAHYPVSHLPVEIAPHGPYDHHVTPAARAEVEVSARNETEFNILFFGTIRPYKGLEHLVAAFDALTPEQVAGLRLTVVGETWEGWTGPIQQIARSRYRDRITLVNHYVHDDDVAAYFAGADAVVLPYTRSSASGPLHIAMAAGLPVVVTDVGGLREAAGDYAGALWVPPSDPEAIRDAIVRLPALRGERYADPRSWQDTVAAYDRLQHRVMACA